jgi:hypothetical protein
MAVLIMAARMAPILPGIVFQSIGVSELAKRQLGFSSQLP